jgi:hypothetical protein
VLNKASISPSNAADAAGAPEQQVAEQHPEATAAQLPDPSQRWTARVRSQQLRLLGPANPTEPADVQNTQIRATTTLIEISPISAPNGGYLEPSLSLPHLTRTSAAWTCS